jgi:hypothetical protein
MAAELFKTNALTPLAQLLDKLSAFRSTQTQSMKKTFLSLQGRNDSRIGFEPGITGWIEKRE